MINNYPQYWTDSDVILCPVSQASDYTLYISILTVDIELRTVQAARIIKYVCKHEAIVVSLSIC